MSYQCQWFVLQLYPLAALAVLNSSKFAQPPRPAAQRWLQRLGPTNGGVAMFVALFGGTWNLWAQRCSAWYHPFRLWRNPIFRCFCWSQRRWVMNLGFICLNFTWILCFPSLPGAKRTNAHLWQRHQDGTRDAGTVLQEKFQEIVVAGLPKILLDNHRGTRLARSGVDIHQVQMVQTRRIHNFHTARRQTRRPEGHNQRMCIFLIDQNLGSMWTKNC